MDRNREGSHAMNHLADQTLLLAMTGETFLLSSRPVWVRPLQIALSVQGA
jgi:hypothetical protein